MATADCTNNFWGVLLCGFGTLTLLLGLVGGVSATPPVNDKCINAIEIGATESERVAMRRNDIRQSGLSVPIDNSEATLEAEYWAWNNGQTSTGNCNEGGLARPNTPSYKRGTGVTADIWYTFTGHDTGRLSLSTCGLTTFQSVISVYEGGVDTTCDPVVNNRRSEFTCLAIDFVTHGSICTKQAGGDVVFNVQPSQKYLIRISTVNGRGTGTLQVKFEPSFPQLPDCTQAGPQCQNGGTCDTHNNVCVCQPGYYGIRCQNSGSCGESLGEGEENLLCESYQGRAVGTLSGSHQWNKGDVATKLTTCGKYGAMLGPFHVNDTLSVSMKHKWLKTGTYRVTGRVLAIDLYSSWAEIGMRVNHGIGEKWRTEGSSSYPIFNEIDTDRNGWKHDSQCGNPMGSWRLFAQTEVELLVQFSFTLSAELDTSTTPLQFTLFNYGWDHKFGLLSLSVEGPIHPEGALIRCEHTTAALSCPSGGKVISISYANYGRTDGGRVCPHTHVSDTTCSATNSESIVKSLCEGKTHCMVTAANHIFGDPCSGTYKYLAIKYSCVAPPSIIIRSAQYGGGSCSGWSDQSNNLQGACDGKAQCTYNVDNGVIGDPTYGCPKPYQYAYSCSNSQQHLITRRVVPAEASGKSLHIDCTGASMVRRSCEQSSVSLQCPANSGSVISISYANYGRTEGSSVCPHSHVSNTTCSASNSESIVKSLCEGKTHCTVTASNSQFGDPCDGTYKYLEVEYSCVGWYPSHQHGKYATQQNMETTTSGTTNTSPVATMNSKALIYGGVVGGAMLIGLVVFFLTQRKTGGSKKHEERVESSESEVYVL